MKADSTHNVWRGLASREVLFVVVLNTAIVVFVVWLWLIRYGWPEQVVRRVLTAFVFAYCIGTLLALALLRLVPRFAAHRFYVRWPLLVVTIAGSAILGFCLGAFILSVSGIRSRDYSWLNLPEDILFALQFAFVFGISGYVYQMVRVRLDATTLRLRTAELERERARKLAAEASLASLESRIHPHFLFNTLNSISGLIQEDPVQAERMVERLAALLRFSLDSSAQSVVSLEQELKIVTDYLEIERVRFADRLRYRVELPPEFLSIQVPPLTLQTLVENSIKHVAACRPRGVEIRIVARREKTRLHLEVQDDGPGFAHTLITPGHGLDNLRERLRALFGDKAALDVSIAADGMRCVCVSLPAMPLASSGDLPEHRELVARALGTTS